MTEDNNENAEGTKTILLILITALSVILLMLTSCTTIRESEVSIVRDTLTVYRSDTVRDVRTLHVHDTVRVVTERVVMQDANGNTIKETNNNWYTERVVVVDSTDRYKSVVDSLQRVINEREKDKVTKKEKLPWWMWPVTLIMLAFGAWLLGKKGVV